VNAATLIDVPRIASREIRPLTPDEARALLVATREQMLDAFVTVALGCGLRLGEALGLQWADVDLDAGTLQLRRAVQRFGGDAAARRRLRAERVRLQAALKALPRTQPAVDARARLTQELQTVRGAMANVKTSVQITELKSARSRRTIALPAVAIEALRSHRVRQLEARLAAGGRWQDRGFVFTSLVGTPLDPRNVTRKFKALLTAAKLPNIRLHDLRHSCATLLLAQGVSHTGRDGDARALADQSDVEHLHACAAGAATGRGRQNERRSGKLVRQLVCQRPDSATKRMRRLMDFLDNRGEPGGNRTLNPQIKSLLLCQLSYRPVGCGRNRRGRTPSPKHPILA
jgi:integrase